MCIFHLNARKWDYVQTRCSTSHCHYGPPCHPEMAFNQRGNLLPAPFLFGRDSCHFLTSRMLVLTNLCRPLHNKPTSTICFQRCLSAAITPKSISCDHLASHSKWNYPNHSIFDARCVSNSMKTADCKRATTAPLLEAARTACPGLVMSVSATLLLFVWIMGSNWPDLVAKQLGGPISLPTIVSALTLS